MTAVPRKHPTGGQKLKRSNWIYPGYDLWERLKRLGKKKNQKTFFGKQGKPTERKSLQAQPQRGWTAQPAQPAQDQQPIQQPPVSKLWQAMILIIMAILALIVVAHILSDIMSTSGPGSNPSGDCICYCDNGQICTSNSQCPDSPPGVPGICGCPVGC